MFDPTHDQDLQTVLPAYVEEHTDLGHQQPGQQIQRVSRQHGQLQRRLLTAADWLTTSVGTCTLAASQLLN